MTRNQVAGGIALICLVGVALLFGSRTDVDTATADSESIISDTQTDVGQAVSQNSTFESPQSSSEVLPPGSVGGEPLRPEFYDLDATLQWLRESGADEAGIALLADTIVVPDPLTKLNCVESDRGTCERVLSVHKSLPHPYYDYPVEALEALAYSDAAAAQIAAEKHFELGDESAALQLAYRGAVISGKAGPLLKIRELIAEAGVQAMAATSASSTLSTEQRAALIEREVSLQTYRYVLEVVSNDFLPEGMQVSHVGTEGLLGDSQLKDATSLLDDLRNITERIQANLGEGVQG